MAVEGAAGHRVAAHALQADLGEGRPPRDALQQLQDGRHHRHEVKLKVKTEYTQYGLCGTNSVPGYRATRMGVEKVRLILKSQFRFRIRL